MFGALSTGSFYWSLLKVKNKRSAGFLLAAVLAAGLAACPAAQAVIIDPDEPSKAVSPDQYPHLVEKLIGRGDFDEALAIIDEALQKNPVSVQLRFQRCVAYERMGEKARAAKLYEDFIVRYPEIPEPYNNLASIYASEGKLDRAQELVERALALRPTFALAYRNLGQIYLAKAKNAFESSLSNAPGSRSVQNKIKAIDELLK